MTDRDRLIELLEDTLQEWECDVTDKTLQEIAEHLIENGVIVPPCKVGDKVYFLCRNQETYEWYICEKEVYSITVHENGTDIYVSPICNFIEMEIGVRLFLTREEAEKALKERKQG